MLMTVLTGSLGSSVRSKVDPMALMKERRISIGLSTLMCMFRSIISSLSCQLTLNPSDSHNPQTAAKQIMAIAPIVQGQRESAQFQIPPHTHSSLANQAPSQDKGPAADTQA